MKKVKVDVWFCHISGLHETFVTVEMSEKDFDRYLPEAYYSADSVPDVPCVNKLVKFARTLLNKEEGFKDYEFTAIEYSEDNEEEE